MGKPTTTMKNKSLKDVLLVRAHRGNRFAETEPSSDSAYEIQFQRTRPKRKPGWWQAL